MEFMLEMPMIEECDVSNCAFNHNETCHAKAITVGDGVTPGCDTFMSASQHVQNTVLRAGVGACKVSGCEHNTDFECGAEGGSVAARDDGVFCMTYLPE
jgi:hypothetical protein